MRSGLLRYCVLWALTGCPYLCAAADPRGPVFNPGMRAQVSGAGVEATGYHFTPARETGHWHAPWIWISQEGRADTPVAAYFRKQVTLPDSPNAVRARISADTVYRLYVNGKLVSRGPDDPGVDYAPRTRWSHQWLYDVRDLTPFFHKGENVISSEVFTKGQPNYSLEKPGFVFAAEFSFTSGLKMTVTSGVDWKALPSAAWSMAEWKADGDTEPVPYLRFDAGKEPVYWRMAGFDDSAWPHATRVESVWEGLAASKIPPRMEAIYPCLRVVRASDGVTVNRGSVFLTKAGSFAVQFDRVLSAYVSIRARGPAGAVLTIQPNEINAPGFHRMTAVVLGKGVTYYEFPVMDSFSAVNITASNVNAPVQIEEVRASFVSQPVSYRGSFESSDPELNRIWNASRWATQLCMQTHHLDSPHHQEPISDFGDYLIEALENYYAFGEPWLIRQDLRKFGLLLKSADYLNFHTSYSLLWLQSLMDYYDYTGDVALVKELAPIAYGLLERFSGWRGKNGLISQAPNYMFMDWVNIAGIPCHHPPAVIGQGYMTAFYYRGLADAERIARMNGDTARAARYERLRSEVAAAFQRELWNPAEGLYRDGKPFQTTIPPSQWLPADSPIETFSPHVNILAVLYDLAPEPVQKPVIERLMSGAPVNVQRYFMHFLFGAMAHAGLLERYGVPEMHRWQIKPDTGTFTEMWDGGDYSHGWGGTPLIHMSSHILGVTPSSPGYRTVAIRPLPLGLAWARGVVPTPRGNVEVAWERSQTAFSLHLTIPPDSRGEVYLPLAGFDQPAVSLDGRPVPVTRPGGKMVVQAGPHNFRIEDRR